MATYYVDYTGGNDGNTGLATDQAWKTTGKVNTEMSAGTFGAGDEVLFKRGETWPMTNLISLENCAGVGGNPFTIGAYGAGNKPILDGQFNDIFIFHRNALDPSADYVTIENLHLKRNSSTGQAGFYIPDIDYLEISACEFTNIRLAARLFNGANDCTIDGCTINDTYSEGLYLGTAGDFTQTVNDATISNCTIQDTQWEAIDWKEGVYDSTMEDCYIVDAVLVSNSSPADFIAWGGIRNTCQRVKVEMDDSYTDNGIRVGKYNAVLNPVETETAHIVRQCLFLTCTSEFGISVYGDGNFIYDNACINGAGGIEIASSGLGTANKQTLRGNYFSGNSSDDITCLNTSMTDSDYNCYADAGSWYIGSSRTLSYVRATYGFEENSRPYISIQPGTSVYVNDIKNITNGDGMIYVDVTYRLYGVAQHRTSHVMRLGNSDEWRHEILMNFKLYIDRDSDFSTRAADDRDTDIATDANDPEGIIADADVAALISAETWLYYDA